MRRKVISKKDVIRFNTLLHRRSMMDQKRDLIHLYSNGRTDRTLEMKPEELEQLINALDGNQPYNAKNHVRRGIFSFCYTMGIINNDMDNKEKMDAVTAYIESHPKIGNKKHINAYTLPELQNLYWQFKISAEYFLTKTEQENEDSNINQ